VLTESLLLAFSASLLGIALGLSLSAYNVHESLRFQLGWQLPLASPLPVVVSVLVLAQLTGALSAWLPMRTAANVGSAEGFARE